MSYIVKNSSGEYVNSIAAGLSWLEEQYPNHTFEKIVEPVPDKEEIEREWRTIELVNTDWIIPLTDHPQHAAYITYRKALRDWPRTSNFPDTRPTL